MDCRSCLEALSRFNGKSPALRGLPFTSSSEFSVGTERNYRKSIATLTRSTAIELDLSEGTLSNFLLNRLCDAPSSGRDERLPVLLDVLPDFPRQSSFG